MAGAENFGFGAGHPMSEMLRLMALAVHAEPASVAFWFPAVLASLVAGIVAAWVWILGSLEAGVAAGLLTCLAPGFLARTLLGFYDTDLVTLFFPLFMTLAPAAWATRRGQTGFRAGRGPLPPFRQSPALAVGAFPRPFRRHFLVDPGMAFRFPVPHPL